MNRRMKGDIFQGRDTYGDDSKGGETQDGRREMTSLPDWSFLNASGTK